MLVALVACETLLLILLAVLVAGLLRSHAEILRRLEAGAGDDRIAPDLAAPRARAGTRPAHDVAGTTLDGDGVHLGLGPGAPNTLIAFLSSGCLTCAGFWETFRKGTPSVPGGARLVIVTKDSSHESPTRLRELAPEDPPVIMSSATWERYGVPTSPYFVYVDGRSGEVHGEGAATGWQQVSSLLRDALADTQAERSPELAGGRSGEPLGDRSSSSDGQPSRSPARSGSGPERLRRVDRELEAAGIGPGHPSLYPAGRETSTGQAP